MTGGAGPGGADPGGARPGGARSDGEDLRGAGREPARARWGLGLSMYAVEVVAVGFLALLFGGLSAMLADTCFRGSTELICEPRWQTIMAATPITAWLVTVAAFVGLMWWRRRFWLVVAAMVATPVVPLVAFLVMEAVVTA
ncbi:MAG: hypothetical protein H5T80_03420 [Dietzia sp.]|nr:hypothetical protein ES5_08786 [Dietzia cinnamea P4]MBC7305976.1 hypothetical protein [Dietzia sp.]OAH63881.1 hypothetical protein AYJ66_10330 [Dietzia cinnamea]